MLAAGRSGGGTSRQRMADCLPCAHAETVEPSVFAHSFGSFNERVPRDSLLRSIPTKSTLLTSPTFNRQSTHNAAASSSWNILYIYEEGQYTPARAFAACSRQFVQCERRGKDAVGLTALLTVQHGTHSTRSAFNVDDLHAHPVPHLASQSFSPSIYLSITNVTASPAKTEGPVRRNRTDATPRAAGRVFVSPVAFVVQSAGGSCHSAAFSLEKRGIDSHQPSIAFNQATGTHYSPPLLSHSTTFMLLLLVSPPVVYPCSCTAL